MKYRHLTKARKGTLAWIDTSINPQIYRNEITGYVTDIIGMGTFNDPKHGVVSLLKVHYTDKFNSKIQKTGYLTEVLAY